MGNRLRDLQKFVRALSLIAAACSLQACVSEAPLAPDKSALVHYLDFFYQKHTPLTDTDLREALGIDLRLYVKTCLKAWNTPCTYTLAQNATEPEPYIHSLSVDKIIDLKGHKKGLVGERIHISFNDKYCLSADEFSSATGVGYELSPSYVYLCGAGSIQVPDYQTIKDNYKGNTIRFERGCNKHMMVTINYDEPEN